MFWTTPVGVTPASKRIARSRPPVVTRNERREARLGNQGVGQPVVSEGRGYARLCEVVKPGHSLDLLGREEQRVGQVVHQDGDPDGVDRLGS
jgi:hypothetical protein